MNGLTLPSLQRKSLLGLAALGFLAFTIFSNTALAHDRDDYRDGYRAGWRNRTWIDNRRARYYRPVVKAPWIRPGRVAYLPGNRWGYSRNHPVYRRGWW